MSDTFTARGTNLHLVMAEIADHLQDAPGFVLSGVRQGQPQSWTVTAHAVIPGQRSAEERPVVKLCSVCGLVGGSHRLFCSAARR